ncbi:MAG: ornithine carbamoyltransferase [Polyangiales bacterium]
MAIGMEKKRDFLSLKDLSKEALAAILEGAHALKNGEKCSHNELLRGRAIAVVLEKASTRTRVSFEVGIAQLGAQPVVIGVDGSQIGRGEPIKDTARVLSRYCDGIAYRTSIAARLTEMAQFASVPVINALSDDGHPLQVLSDVFTIAECFPEDGGGPSMAGKKVAFIGDCASNVARSWIEAAPLFGFQLALAAPPKHFPPRNEVLAASEYVTLHSDPGEAVQGADVVTTDVWASMGQEDQATDRRRDFAGFTVDEPMLARAATHAIVLHCLPAHRGEEIADSVLEGPQSRVWVQAENRLHVQKSLLCWLLEVTIPVEKPA